MDNLTLESFFTYLLLLISLICSYYVIRKVTTALRYRMIVLVIGIVSLTLLTWGLVDNKIMDYQDANIGLGLIFYLTWTVIVVAFLVSIIISFYISRKGKGK
ncbi:potassium transporter Kef [Peribacillus sp. NPDC097675]|uniref:potassium transporter Kef n=1 Tax=Peribacillus sp. NPDC097675 TaxID=3390618 RepID=UPI003D010EE7